MTIPHLSPDDLTTIRHSCDWTNLFHALNLEIDQKKSKPHDLWAKSPLSPQEKTASFHVRLDRREWHCFSQQKGGGCIELVQEVVKARTGQTISCFDAGRWILDHNVASIAHRTDAVLAQQNKPTAHRERKKEEALKINKPIRQDLVPALDPAHSLIANRGISESTAKLLRFGYLDPKKSRSILAGRLVFQIRGVQENGDGHLKPVILSHMGRATTSQQEEETGKWMHYAGFHKSSALYNIDFLTNRKAVLQVKRAGVILLVEGCFDVAKLAQAGHVGVGLLGAHLSEFQIPLLRLIAERTGVHQFRCVLDRDGAGIAGMKRAMTLLRREGFTADGFNWSHPSSDRYPGKSFTIPNQYQDVCDLEVPQIQWLHRNGFL